jgi:hypothetical protein
VSFDANRETFKVEDPETASAVTEAEATVASDTVALRVENFDELPESVNDDAVDCSVSSFVRKLLKNIWRCVNFDCEACMASTAGCRVLRYAAARSSDAFWPSAENPFPTMNVVFVTLVAMFFIISSVYNPPRLLRRREIKCLFPCITQFRDYLSCFIVSLVCHTPLAILIDSVESVGQIACIVIQGTHELCQNFVETSNIAALGTHDK